MTALVLAAVLCADAGATSRLPYAVEIDAAVADVARVYPVPASLVLAVIRQESGFVVRAESKAGARGLMQVMPANAERLGLTSPDELWVPARNILAGVRLLAVLLKHYAGDVVASLVAYNAGPRPADVVPSNGETPEYVVRILRFWREYAAAFPPVTAAQVGALPLPNSTVIP